HRKGAKDALPHVPLQRGRKGEEREINFTEELSSITKSQGFSEIFSIYFLKNNTFASLCLCVKTGFD
ncbi:MAG TPA: hypothetical protein ACFYD4_13510, partial [Candidatus Wunengus sp. YC61]|uniref:hypothetical protein n=1 Tax=Candidatus Wunengus sp. YC61 TaxID=3367698 RepID=UPI0040266B9F